MAKYTFKRLAEDVLDARQRPMSGEEIWAAAQEIGLADKVGSSGKTPERSIGAQIYTDIRDNAERSVFRQVSKRPAKFALSSFAEESMAAPDEAEGVADDPDGGRAREGDLHRLLATFVGADDHFRCYAKTIDEAKSRKKKRNSERWTHPDMVGVRFAFEDYENETMRLIEVRGESPCTLFSFELKSELKSYNVRESFFQAVSNSSWANEGYLVAKDISAEVLDDLQRLSGAFGIGVIRLDIDNIEQSEVLFPAACRENLDWDTVNHIVSLGNSDFIGFIDDVLDDMRSKKVRSEYDEPIDADEMDSYLASHGLK